MGAASRLAVVKHLDFFAAAIGWPPDESETVRYLRDKPQAADRVYRPRANKEALERLLKRGAEFAEGDLADRGSQPAGSRSARQVTKLNSGSRLVRLPADNQKCSRAFFDPGVARPNGDLLACVAAGCRLRNRHAARFTQGPWFWRGSHGAAY